MIYYQNCLKNELYCFEVKEIIIKMIENKIKSYENINLKFQILEIIIQNLNHKDKVYLCLKLKVKLHIFKIDYDKKYKINRFVNVK